MKKNKLFFAFLLLAFAFLTAGCWNLVPIDELTYLVAIGVDNKPQREGQKISQQIYTFSIPIVKEKPKEPRKVWTIVAPSVVEAIDGLQAQSSKKIIVGHTRTVIFSEAVAQEDVYQQLDFYVRSANVPGDAALAISSGQSAQKLLNQPTTDDPGMGVYVYNLLHKLSAETFVSYKSINDIFIEALNYGVYTIPLLTMAGKNTYCSGLAMIKNDKMIGKLNRLEAQELCVLQAGKKSGIISYLTPQDSHYAAVTAKTKIIPFWQKGKFSFLIKVDMVGELIDSNLVKNDFFTSASLKKLEKKFAQAQEKELRKLMSKLQEKYAIDIIHLGEAAYIKYPHHFEEKKWQELYPKADVQIKVNVKLQKTGVIM